MPVKDAAPAGNLDRGVVEGFGREWSRFDQSRRSEADLRATFESCFRIFPWERLPENAAGFDLGCGSGRWARFVAGRVGSLLCIDASREALAVARRNLDCCVNVGFLQASAGSLSLAARTFDFGYSLGVLHHVPSPALGLADAVRLLKPGAPLLLYLYYALDNRPWWYRALWRLSNAGRVGVSALPTGPRHAVSELIALTVYWPLSRTAWVAQRLGLDCRRVPLAAYRDKPLYVLRTDALDRFGTRIEHRFSRDQVVALMESCGLERVSISAHAPYWCAVGYAPAPGAEVARP
jgi:SAM-dependent methyltransferase